MSGTGFATYKISFEPAKPFSPTVTVLNFQKIQEKNKNSVMAVKFNTN